MNKLVRELGTTSLTTIIIVIPMLTACGFCLRWSNFIKWILILLTIGEWVGVYAMIWERSDEA